MSAGGTASAQKHGGILRIYNPDSPGGMSILEEATVFARGPMMGVFNNLVMFDQHVPQNSLQSIVPDLATSWSWNEEGTELTFQLRQRRQMARRQAVHGPGRQMHLGSADGSGAGETADQSAQVSVLQPCRGDHERRLRGHLSSEAAAAGVSDAARGRFLGDLSLPRIAGRTCGSIRSAPARSNSSSSSRTNTIKVTRNPDYWKPDRPYLDGIEYTIIKDPSTATLAFTAGKFDMTFPYTVLTIPLMKNIESQMPQAICELHAEATGSTGTFSSTMTSRPSTIPAFGGRWR